MHRIGLVGVGKMGISHLAIAGAHPRLECAGVCDSQPFVLSAVRSQLGLPTYKTFDAMIAAADLDAVVVSTPTSSHAALARRALEHGLGVFVEKPLTLSAEESSGLADLADERGLANQVGYHNRFIGTFREAARLVAAGAIGDVHHVDGRAFGPVVTKSQGAGRTWRAKQSEGGGCLHDYACHVVDLLNFLVGPPTDVVGARLGRVHSSHVEDTVYAMFDYGDGATGTVETNWSDESSRKMTTSITIHGTHGTIHADRQECRLYLQPGFTFEKFESGWTVRYITELQAPVDFYLRGEEYSAQLDALGDALEGNPHPEAATFAAAAATDRVVEAIAALDGGVPRARSVPGAGEADVTPTDEFLRAVKRYVRSLSASTTRAVGDLTRKLPERRT
jgi:predicted dehydrogenase